MNAIENNSLIEKYHSSDAYKNLVHTINVLTSMQSIQSGERGTFSSEFIPFGGSLLRLIKKWDYTFGLASYIAEEAISQYQGKTIDSQAQVQSINQLRDDILQSLNKNLEFIQQHPDKELKNEIEKNINRMMVLVSSTAQVGLSNISQSFSDQKEKQLVQRVSKEFHDQITQRISKLKTEIDSILAAVTLQKFIRRAQEERHILPDTLYKKYKNFSQNISQTMPRASAGKTPVYLPNELPDVVLKETHSSNATKRFHQMRYLRELLEKQGSRHLIIPRAFYSDYLIEERLPINPNIYFNMKLYIEHHSLFDDAVREMTRLFSETYIDDLIGYGSARSYIAGGDVRFDNMPLYLVENEGKLEGKVGLIDLEKLETEKSEKLSPALKLAILARIFPFHLEIIKEEAKKLHMQYNEKVLNRQAENGKKYLKLSYSDHIQYLKTKGILTDKILEPFKVSTDRITTLTNLIEKELLKLNEGINDYLARTNPQDEQEKGFLGENSQGKAKELAPRICQELITTITSGLNESVWVHMLKNKDKISETEIIDTRSPAFTRAHLFGSARDFLTKNIKFNTSHMLPYTVLSEQLLQVVMEDLVKGGELFFWDPVDASEDYGLCWVKW